jgi:Lon protease-like protein
MGSEPLAMFPLAAVVFPGTELPLHVFERRYQCLTRDVLLGSKEFGICLISRGSEVGGDDQRVDVGTRVRIDLAAPLEGDRWILVTTGVERFVVREWLADDPYPRAIVEDLPSVGPPASHEDLVKALSAVKGLRRLQSELADGWTSPCIDLKLEECPVSALWMLCAMAPLSLCDLQKLLEVPTDAARLALLRELCGAKARDLEQVLLLDQAP